MLSLSDIVRIMTSGESEYRVRRLELRPVKKKG